jgi:hypothetical protein
MQSKKRNAIIGIVLISTAFLLVSYTRWPIETPLSQILSPRETYYVQTEKLVYEVADDLMNIRELNGPNEIKIQIVNVEWTKENWGRKTNQAEINQLKIEEEIYKHLFIVPKDFDLLAQKEQEAGSILAALWGDTLYFVSDYFDPYNEVNAKETIAHEMAHLLQSINFKIGQSVKLDATLARGALVEGEAEVTKAQYLELVLNKRVDKDSFPVGNQTISVDEFFWLKWVAPGIFGIEFVEMLYREGGWIQVNNAFIDVPKTMEQIIHPEKYTVKENYLDFEEEMVEDWDLERSDRFGELFIILFLARHIPVDEARVAAQGWGGDNFAYYKKHNEYFFEWKTTWDTTTDADQFINALESLFGSIEAKEIAPKIWKINEEYLKIKNNNWNVTIIGSSNYETLENL